MPRRCRAAAARRLLLRLLRLLRVDATSEDGLRRQRVGRVDLGDLPRRLHTCREPAQPSPRTAPCSRRPSAAQVALVGRNALAPRLHLETWSRTAHFGLDVVTIILPTMAAALLSSETVLLFCGACVAALGLRRSSQPLEYGELNGAHPPALTTLRAIVMLQARTVHVCPAS